MADTQPSQLNPFYPLPTIGPFGTAGGDIAQSWWGTWRPQAEPFPVEVVAWFPAPPNDELAAYALEMAGTAADLDTVLEAAAIEHLLRDDQPDRQ